MSGNIAGNLRPNQFGNVLPPCQPVANFGGTLGMDGQRELDGADPGGERQGRLGRCGVLPARYA